MVLYPVGIASGSWFFINSRTKTRVRQSGWQLMVTSDEFIQRMHHYEGIVPEPVQSITTDTMQVPGTRENEQPQEDPGLAEAAIELQEQEERATSVPEWDQPLATEPTLDEVTKERVGVESTRDEEPMMIAVGNHDKIADIAEENNPGEEGDNPQVRCSTRDRRPNPQYAKG